MAASIPDGVADIADSLDNMAIAAMPKSKEDLNPELFSFARLMSRRAADPSFKKQFEEQPIPITTGQPVPMFKGQPMNCYMLQKLSPDLVYFILDSVDLESAMNFSNTCRDAHIIFKNFRNDKKFRKVHISVVPALPKYNLDGLKLMDVYARKDPGVWICLKHSKIHKVDLSVEQCDGPGGVDFRDVPGQQLERNPFRSRQRPCDQLRPMHPYDVRCGTLLQRHIYLLLKYARLDHSCDGRLQHVYKRHMEALLATRRQRNEWFELYPSRPNRLRVDYRVSPRIVVGPRLIDEEDVVAMETNTSSGRQVLRYVQKSEWRYRHGRNAISVATLGHVKVCPHLSHRPQDFEVIPGVTCYMPFTGSVAVNAPQNSDGRLTEAIVSVMLPGRPYHQVGMVRLGGAGSVSSVVDYDFLKTIPAGATIERAVSCRWCRTDVLVKAVFNTHDSLDPAALSVDFPPSRFPNGENQHVSTVAPGTALGPPTSLSEFIITAWQDLGPEEPEGSMTWIDNIARQKLRSTDVVTEQPTRQSQDRLYALIRSGKMKEAAPAGLFRDGTKVGSIKDLYEQSALHMHDEGDEENLRVGRNHETLRINPSYPYRAAERPSTLPLLNPRNGNMIARPRKVAIITGAASGMGLDVARLLAKTQPGVWNLHLFDINETAGAAVAAEISSPAGHGTAATFHEVDIGRYDTLASAFHAVWAREQRLDFVFANAGLFERPGFWDEHGGADEEDVMSVGPPPEQDWAIVEVNVKGTMNTCYLARHYFRLDGRRDGVLVVTGSCTALYPSELTPRYSASKAALLNFVQGIAPAYLSRYGIRVSTILPGAVLTNFVAEDEWPDYPPDWFTPLQQVAETVVKLASGTESLEDAWGNQVEPKGDSGLVVELGVGKIYFRKPHEFCDETMRKVMGKVAVEQT
ncbi:hypothetical protein Micbo1qcDRAFT_203776 [Microdochium bolleyi]|uniref:Uncharacterized protein n=1 Tax=Microdochium bolleyi TaxID=196109 RepID=A0A136J3A2_9PEZI|nr:hypothetical protein Micbo1qcDRAFT_203776 [Microdochium bolleyi]